MALISLAVCACSAITGEQETPPEGTLPADLVEARDVVRTGEPARLLEARWDLKTASLYLMFEIDGQRYFGRTSDYDKQDLAMRSDWVDVFYMETAALETFEQDIRNSHAITIIPADVAQEFRIYVLENLVPHAPGVGILVNDRDREYFTWRNEAGEVQWVEGMFNKPPEVPLSASYRFETLGEMLSVLVSSFLDDQGYGEHDAVIFETGETGPYARPFALYTQHDDVWRFVSLEPFTFGSMPQRYVSGAGKTVWNLARSYWWEFWNRPVSFFTRLGFFVTDTAWDLGQGITIRAFRFPDLDDIEIPPLNEGPGMDLDDWNRTLDDKYGHEIYPGKAKLRIGGDQFFPFATEAAFNAKEYLKLRTYIFDNDDFALRIADGLKAVSKRIDVKVMLDGLGTQMAQNTPPGMMPQDYSPPIGITNYLRDGSEIDIRILTNPWFTGDHTKTTIVDGKTAFVGGMNIGREYRWEWHDIMVELNGPIVQAIEYEFDKAWAHSEIAGDLVYPAFLASTELETGPARDGDYGIRILKTLPRQSEIYRAQLNAIKRAKSHIWIENAYFASTMVLYELVKARLRGVDVRVILPMSGNHGIMNKANVPAANTLLAYGARVFIYPGMSHIKAGIYDGWACLGSANFDKLSFRVNKELNLGISDPVFVNDLKQQVFEADMANAVELLEPLPENWGNTWASIVASQL
jgi:cardiolipin synthase